MVQKCGCPAVLVEEGFITNAGDVALVATDAALSLIHICALAVRQAAALGLDLPCLTGAVAVEDHAAVLVQRLFDPCLLYTSRCV